MSMKKRKWFLISILLLNLLILAFNFVLIDKQRVYYIGKITSIERLEDQTIFEIEPTASPRFSIKPIKSEHVIIYDNSNISGIGAPGKETRKLRLGELSELADALKVGDPLIVRLEEYDQSRYHYDVREIAFDLTI